jgi:hypothetical protein
MLRHIVLVRFAQDTPDEVRRRAVDELAALPGLVPSIRGYTVGLDAGLGGTHDLAIVGDFDDAEGWQAYQQHPEHVRVAEQHVRPHTAERASTQFVWEP